MKIGDLVRYSTAGMKDVSTDIGMVLDLCELTATVSVMWDDGAIWVHDHAEFTVITEI